MVKKLLQGPREEQCEFLYDLGVEKMQSGNFAGAYYAFKEVARHNPGFQDVQLLLAEVKARKAEQRLLIVAGLVGGAVFVALGRMAGLSHDLALIAAGAVGLVCGYAVCSRVRQGGFKSLIGGSLT